MAGRRLWGGYPLLDRLAVSGRVVVEFSLLLKQGIYIDIG